MNHPTPYTDAKTDADKVRVMRLLDAAGYRWGGTSLRVSIGRLPDWEERGAYPYIEMESARGFRFATPREIEAHSTHRIKVNSPAQFIAYMRTYHPFRPVA